MHCSIPEVVAAEQALTLKLALPLRLAATVALES
jgi:hypothetical protein